MPQALTNYVSRWCQAHGWTDLFIERYEYWAFPPGGVMPAPVPTAVVEGFIQDRAQQARSAYLTTMVVTVLAAVVSYWQQSPMPLTCAFCFGALAVALVDESVSVS